MKNVPTTLAALLAASALTMSLSGCGAVQDLVGGDDPAPAATTATATATTTTAPDTGPEGEQTPSPTPLSSETDADLTPPGTELALGEWATVPFSYTSDAEGVIKLRITSVDRPAPSDLAAFDAATQAKLAGYEARYLRIEVEGVSGDNLSFAGVYGFVNPVTADGRRGQQLNPLNNFAPCNADSLPSGFGPGSQASTCVIGLVGNGHSEIVGGMYSQTDSEYSQYGGSRPVVWR